MPNRLNYTARKTLSAHEASVRIYPDPAGKEPATFDVDLSLEALRPDADDALVFVEAHIKSTRMRFDYGTVSMLSPPPPDRRQLTEFDNWELINFRVKVTDITEMPGKIIAWRNRFKPHGPKDYPENDLIRFINADLNGLVWDLEFHEIGPVVRIDHEAGDRHSVGSDKKFVAAVYPEILRRTLIQALIEEQEDGNDKEHWSHAWFNGLIKQQLGMDTPPPLGEKALSEQMDWISEVVQIFAQRYSLNCMWKADAKENI